MPQRPAWQRPRGAGDVGSTTGAWADIEEGAVDAVEGGRNKSPGRRRPGDDAYSRWADVPIGPGVIARTSRPSGNVNELPTDVAGRPGDEDGHDALRWASAAGGPADDDER